MAQPDFIGIGMERAGSSWVFYMLASHPDVWVPPIKELHYFDSIDPQSDARSWRYSKHFKIRVLGKAAPFVKKPEDRPQFFKNTYLRYLQWDLRYFLGDTNHEWYRSLFAPQFTKGRICGEITAAYSTLSENTIADLCKNFPQTKFIMSVRDPIERTKSALFHHFRGIHGRKINDCKEEELLEWLDEPLVIARSDILRMIDLWQKHAGNRLHLIDFEDIARNPDTLIHDLYTLLDLESTFRPPPKLIGEKVFSFKTGNDDLPVSVNDKIINMHKDARKIIKERYPALVKHWQNV